MSGRGPKPKKRVVINEAEAQWVRQVFAWFNEGRSMKSIVRELNRLKVDKGMKLIVFIVLKHSLTSIPCGCISAPVPGMFAAVKLVSSDLIINEGTGIVHVF